MNFNLKLKKIRTFRKMTQKELSEKIGLTDQHRIVQYEKGVRVPKKIWLIKWHRLLMLILIPSMIPLDVTLPK